MEKVDVSLGERSYSIHIGTDLLGDVAQFTLITPNTQVVIISNVVVAPLYLKQLDSTLTELGARVSHVIFPDGEQTKSLTFLEQLMTYLLEQRAGRDVILVALGGGVIGDLVGFAAAIFQRGVRFIQIPTTLLAQVDSSVGGKTGVNHMLGKNMIGAFYQPKQVVIDIATLQTLPERQFSAGLAEVIKYGVILDSAFFIWLEENISCLIQRDKSALAYCIQRCCEIKAKVVAQDEKERHGVRELLNLGHTFGHAIETFFNYTQWLHGEAVAIGMVMAAEVAHRQGMLSLLDKERIIKLLQDAKLSITRPISMPVSAYLPIMLHDKKNLQGQLRLVLITQLGRGEVITINNSELVVEAIAAC